MSAPGAVSVTAIMRIVFGRRRGGRFIAVLGAFFDDSGTHDDSSLVVIGGLLGTEEQWDAFEADWTSRLANPLPDKPLLKQFHLSACRARRGEFYGYTQAEADHLTYLFRRIIIDTGLVTIAIAANRVAWDELVIGDARQQLGEPIEYCFAKCVEETINTIRFRKPGEQVSIFLDAATKPSLGVWADMFKMMSAHYPELAQFGFAPVEKVVALQGADMIATETYQYNLRWLVDRDAATPNPHFREFMERELTVGRILDREHIEEIVSRFRASATTFAQRPS